MDASPHRLTSAEMMLNSISQLQQDKFDLTRTIEEEESYHEEKVRELKKRISELEADEETILQKHKRTLMNQISSSPLLKNTTIVGNKQNQLQGLVNQLNGSTQPIHQPQLIPQYSSTITSPQIGQEVRVRDTHTEPWKYGVLEGVDQSGRPLVRLKGWEKVLSWNEIEVRPMSAAFT